MEQAGTGIVSVDKDVYHQEYLPKVSMLCLLSYMFIPVF